MSSFKHAFVWDTICGLVTSRKSKPNRNGIAEKEVTVTEGVELINFPILQSTTATVLLLSPQDALTSECATVLINREARTSRRGALVFLEALCSPHMAILIGMSLREGPRFRESC